MTTDTATRTAREREAMRRQPLTHMAADAPPDARGMGAESAVYTEPTIDPQWMDAWKMFLDREGNEYGVPVKLPRLQWENGGANALSLQKRPDGGFWFTTIEPERTKTPGRHVCFVGDCKKPAETLSKLVGHVRAFHFVEAEMYKDVLEKIERTVAARDPRLQQVLADLEAPDAVLGDAVDEETIACAACNALPPEGHENPVAWLRGHKLGAHKDGG